MFRCQISVSNRSSPLLWPQEESEAATPRNSAGVVELTVHYQELTAPATGYTSPEGNDSPDPVVTQSGTTGDG